MKRRLLALATIVVMSTWFGWIARGEEPNQPEPAVIERFLELSETLYSGGEPASEEAFDYLQKLGVKTVISVDGARPNVEAARKRGIRYVHIPIGYDGIDEDAVQKLAQAAGSYPTPIFVHCHHGQHRGPAAAAVVCMAQGTADHKDALNIMKRAGVSKDYPGLWRDVERVRLPAPDPNASPLPEIADVESFAAMMATIDRNFDNLKLMMKNKWGPLADHPDIVARIEARIVRENLHEAGRNLVDDRDEKFRAILLESENAAITLEENLASGAHSEADKSFARLEKSCKDCHAKYRNE